MRALSAALIQAISDDHNYCHLVKFDFSSGAIFLTDCPWDIQYSGDTYLGNGMLQKIDKIKSKTEINVGTFNIGLSADDALIAILLTDTQVNRDVEVYRCYLDDNGQIIDAPLPIWTGLFTEYEHESDDNEDLVTISIASEWADFQKAIGRRTTPASQQKYFATDKGFEFAAEAGKEYPWGRK